jgi:branched-chain amino acid transport system permease protein
VSGKRIIAIVLVIALLALLGLFPAIAKRDDVINLSVLVLLGIILASSWNILGGYTGQTNLGHAAFFGLGALAARLLWLSAGWPLLPSLLAGGGVAVALALLIGAPAFRLRGVYFAIGTLALAQVLNATVGNVWPMISSLPAQYLATYQLVPRYYLFLGVAVLTVGTAYVLVHSRPGLGMMAVREEEDAAESLGVSAFRHKLLALTTSAFFAGLAGGAFAFYQPSYYPQLPFGPVWTFDALMMAYIGGTGTIIGPVIGAIFFVVTKEQLALRLAGVELEILGRPLEFGELHLAVFGTLFILVVLFLPGGLVEAWGKIRQALNRRARRRDVNVTSPEQAS